MELFLFILVNAIFFLRPWDFIPELVGLPIYLISMLACSTIFLFKLASQWSRGSLSDRPITVCVLGMFVIVVITPLMRGGIDEATRNALDFFPMVVYYLLLVGLLDTPARLKLFLVALLLILATMTLILLLQYHGVINVAALKVFDRGDLDVVTGEVIIIPQLRGSGLLNDPNDLCMVLTIGLLIGLYLFNDRGYGIFRLLFLLPVSEFGYAVIRTQSRGGLLSCVAGILTLMCFRIGWKKTLALAVLGLPVVFAVLGGRFSKMSAGEDTAHDRILIWREALMIFRGKPIFGSGMNTIGNELGLVAHNSFVHAYAETGFLGGTFFVGSFFIPFLLLSRLGRVSPDLIPSPLRSLGPYLIAMLVGVAVSLYSITRNYSQVTYLVAGLAEAFQCVVAADRPDLRTRLDGWLARALVAVSLGTVVFLHVFLRFV